MTTPAEYRELALDCMREADRADAAAMRLTMFGLARVWMSVAAELDKHAMQPDDDPRETATATAAPTDTNPVRFKE
jgi:hypothetical protein